MGDLGRYLGLDVGDARIGIALSDPLGIVATPHDVLQSQGGEADAQSIGAIAKEHDVTRIVVGMPLDRQGEEGHQAQKVLAFIDVLRAAVDIEIVTTDERFTTALARRAMNDGGVRRKKQKQIVDKIAAQQILQTYLDRQANLSTKTT